MDTFVLDTNAREKSGSTRYLEKDPPHRIRENKLRVFFVILK